MKFLLRWVFMAGICCGVSWAQGDRISQKFSYDLLGQLFNSSQLGMDQKSLIGWVSGRMFLESSPKEPLAAMIVGRAAGPEEIKVFPLVLAGVPEDFYDDPVRAVYPAKDYIDLTHRNMSMATLSSASAIFNYVEPDQSSKILYELRQATLENLGKILLLRFEAVDSQNRLLRRGFGVYWKKLDIPEGI